MYDIGMIGLAVMGENLSLNIESKGYKVLGYDISKQQMKSFEEGRAKGKNIGFADSVAELVSKLESPRVLMMMIRAGNPVDQVIKELSPLLDAGDIIIDGGNSNYEDSNRRYNQLQELGIHFIGSGVSGGEEGALHGPSLMPGGAKEAWDRIKPIFTAIAAKTEDGHVCTDWIGPQGSGHYVKMVHNGIEYGDIQLITEAYHILRNGLNLSTDEIAEIFKDWNKGELDSYLIDITSIILEKKDNDGLPLVDKILDVAGQKGTGKWTAINSLKDGVPLPLIGESVYARFLSSLKAERIKANKLYKKEIKPITTDKKAFIESLKNALYVAKIISYAQGFSLLRQASKDNDWNLNYGSIASMWRGGCIIRSQFLYKIKQAFDTNKDLENLLLDPYFKDIVSSRIKDYRIVLSQGILHGIPLPSFSAGLSYFDAYTSHTLPANLLQAMRDFFGAHTYKRIDSDPNQSFHTNWTGKGGSTSSTTYNA